MAHSKLDRKRMGKLLGLQSQHSYFALADLLAQRSKKSHSTISTQTLPHSTIHSPSPIKKSKHSAENTQHFCDQDDLYCHENLNEDSTPVKPPKSQLPLQKPYYSINSNYLNDYCQKEYNYKIRAIVVSRIFENCNDLELRCPYIAVELFDRFLARLQNKVVQNQQQLRFLSLSVIYVAAKMNEDAPDISALLSQSSLNMSRAQLFHYERWVLQVLDWHTNPLTVHHYLEDIIIKFQQYFWTKPYKTNLMKVSTQFKLNHWIQLFDEDIQILNQSLILIVMDHNHLQYQYPDIAFSLLYANYKETVPDVEYDEFLSQFDSSLKLLSTTCNYVIKFHKITLKQIQNDIAFNPLESLKLLSD